MFEPGGETLTKTGAFVLDSVATDLRGSTVSLRLDGCRNTTLEKDEHLSQRRARAVLAYLVRKHGLRRDRFTLGPERAGEGRDYQAVALELAITGKQSPPIATRD